MIRNLCILLSAGLLLVASTEAHAKKSVAVLGLEVVDSGGGMDMGTVRLAKALTDKLRSQAAGAKSPYSLAPNAAKGLAEMKLLAGCDSESPRCMASIGKAVGANILLYGKLERTGDGARVSLQLLDVKSAKKLKSVSDVIPEGDWDNLGRWSRSLYARVMGMPENGSLTITANATTGTVLVDGEAAGNLAGGSALVDDLSEGRHRISVESPGYKRWNGEVNVLAGQGAQLEVRMEAVSSTAGPMDGDQGAPGGAARAAFWASLGIGAAAGAFQIVNWFVLRESAISDKEDAFTNIENSADDTEEAAIRAAANNPTGRITNVCGPASTAFDNSAAPSDDLRDLVDACDRGDRTALLSYTAGGVAVVAGAAAAFFFYKGYISADSSDTEEPTVRVIPTVSPNTAGLGLSIDF